MESSVYEIPVESPVASGDRSAEPAGWRDRAEAVLKTPVAVVALFVVFVVLFALHRPDGITNPQLWAEDGHIFHQDAELFGFSSLFIPRMGYFHTIPRIIALLARMFDPAWTPAIYAFSALAISGLVAACLISPRMPGGRLGGLALATLLVMVPNYSGEVFLTPTNIQWVAAPLLAAMLLKSPPATTLSALVEALVCFLVGTTSPFSIVLAPFAWVRLWLNRDGKRLVVTAGLTLAALIQATAILLTGELHRSEPRPMPFGLIVKVFWFRMFEETFTPQIPSGTALALVAVGIFSFFCVCLLAVLPGKWRAERRLLAAVILAYFATTLVRCRDSGNFLLDNGLGDRYFYTIRIHLLWCFWLAFMDALNARHWLAVWLGLLLSLGVVSSVRSYQEEARQDKHWQDFVPALREGRPVDIPVQPNLIYHHRGRNASQAEGK